MESFSLHSGIDSNSQSCLSAPGTSKSSYNKTKSYHRKRRNIIVPHSESSHSTDHTRNSSDLMRENILAFLEDTSKQSVPAGLLHPDSKLINVWNIVVAVLLIYTATVMPFSMAFVQNDSVGVWYILDLTIDGLFFVDLVINCITCYTNDSGVLVVSRCRIFTRYLKSWFLLDLAACFPFSVLETNENTSPSDDYGNFVRLVRLPRIYRLFRLSRIIKMFKHYQNTALIQKLQDFLSLNHSAMRMLGALVSIVIVIHIGGCFWYLSAKIEGFNPDTWVYRYQYLDSDIGTLYITSIYWTITTMATVGYGDISPYTVLEKIFAMIWMIVGLYFFSYTIGSLANMLSHIDTKENVLSTKLAIIDEFSSQSSLSKELRNKLRLAVRYSTEKAGFSWVDKQNLFQELPKKLRYEISMAMHNGVIKEIEFFQDKDQVFIYSIVPFLRFMFVPRMDYIYHEDEYADEFYFVADGNISCMCMKFDIIQNFIKGKCFGDCEVVSQVARQFSARAAKDSELLVLDKNVRVIQLVRVIKEDFKHIWATIENEANQKLINIQKYLSSNAQANSPRIKGSLITFRNPEIFNLTQNSDQEEEAENQPSDLSKHAPKPQLTLSSHTKKPNLSVVHTVYVSIEP